MNATMVQMMAAAEPTGDGQGNLMVGLVIGVVAVAAAIWWFVHRYRAARRPAASRAEHQMLREVHSQRPEQKAMKDHTDNRPLFRGQL